MLMSYHKFITHRKTLFVQMTVKAAGYETKPHINTIGDDTSQFSKTYRPNESQQTSKGMETLQAPQTRPKNEKKRNLDTLKSLNYISEGHTYLKQSGFNSLRFISLRSIANLYKGGHIVKGRNYTSARSSATSWLWHSLFFSPSPFVLKYKVATELHK